MDYSQLKLMSPAANSIFGETTTDNISSSLLQVALRYIQVLRYKEDREKIIPVKIKKLNANTNEEHKRAILDYPNFDILVSTPYDGLSEIVPLDLEGWVEKNEKPYQLSLFLSSSEVPTKVFFNDEAKRVYIVTQRVTQRWIEVFSAALFKLLPRFISPETLSKDDTAFFRSIYNRVPDELFKCANKICDDIDFSNILMRNELKGWSNNYREGVIASLKTVAASARQLVDKYVSDLSAAEDDLRNAMYKLSVFENSPEEDPNSLIDFFEAHKNLSLWKVEKKANGSGKIAFYSVVDTIEYYSEDEFISAYNNDNSYFYRDSSNENIRKLFFAIFKENKGVFKTEAVFKMTNLSSIEPTHGTTELNKDVLPHPHLAEYQCLGGNREPIRRYMESGDWDLAIEQTIAAVKNINFGDTTVLSSLINKIAREWNGGKFIIADNGEQMNCEEFLQYISNESTGEESKNG